MSKIKKVAYLGPEGTYSHIIAQKYFGKDIKKVPMTSIADVCAFADESSQNRGIVPVENSSSGPVAETLDILIYKKFNILIEESLYLNIKLALLGKQKNEDINKIYSHSIPLFHCDSWIREKLPNVETKIASSTAEAAQLAYSEKNAAAIASFNASKLYNLKVLQYPIQQDIPNITQFYSLAKSSSLQYKSEKMKTSIAAFLKDEPGSLYDFLEPFKRNKINMSRIISRPIFGRPYEYAFFVDIDGTTENDNVAKTINEMKEACAHFNIISSYPSEKIYYI